MEFTIFKVKNKFLKIIKIYFYRIIIMLYILKKINYQKNMK